MPWSGMAVRFGMAYGDTTAAIIDLGTASWCSTVQYADVVLDAEDDPTRRQVWTAPQLTGRPGDLPPPPAASVALVVPKESLKAIFWT